MKLTLGTDTEFNVFKGDEPWPMVGLLGGTKEEPKWIQEFCNLQEDNVLAEVATIPCSTRDDFINVCNLTFESLTSELKRIDKQFTPKHGPYRQYHKRHLATNQARYAGCSKSFNVYSWAEEDAPPYGETRRRAAGGHIHVGHPLLARYSADIKQYRTELSRFVSLVELKLERMQQAVRPEFTRPSEIRRELYGKLGSVRFKAYGIELRSPTNFWFPHYSGEVWDIVEEALEHG